MLYFALVLVLLVSNCQADCEQDTKQDCILLVDYSSSIDDDEWNLQLAFASDLVKNHLPSDSRVATMGFGWHGRWVADGWYFGYDKFGSDLASASSYIEDWDQEHGPTYLEEGIRYLLTSGNIDWNDSPDRKRLLVIITDGDAQDYPCRTEADLRALDVETIVIGISDGFNAEKVECLVNDVENDIILATDFVDLNNIIDSVGEKTCSADFTWKLTEIKARGSEKFIEYTNTGGVSDDSYTVAIRSNLISSDPNANSFQLPSVDTEDVPQNMRILISHNYQATCSDAECVKISQTLPEDPSGWWVELYQIINDQGTITEVVIDRVDEQVDFPDAGTEYSLELINVGLDNTLSGSWRRSCEKKGSAGISNADECTTHCTVGVGNECGSENTCTADGCSCSTLGFLEELSACPIIPAPVNCTVFIRPQTDPTITDKNVVTISWNQASTNFVYGYKVTVGEGTDASPTTFWGRVGEWETVLTTSLQDKVFVQTIGEVDTIAANTTDNPSAFTVYTEQRWSKFKTCDTITQFAPTNEPTYAPTWFQPIAFLGDIDFDDTTNEQLPKRFGYGQDLNMMMRIYFSPPEATSVRWGLYGSLLVNGTHVINENNEIEKGTTVFPADATKTGNDILWVMPTASVGSPDDTHYYFFRIKDAITSLADNTGRAAYDVNPNNDGSWPWELEIIVDPVFKPPTAAPTDHQPAAYLEGFKVDADGEPLPLTFTTLQEPAVGIRLSLGPKDFGITVAWNVYEAGVDNITTGNSILNGTHTFPADATNIRQDSIDIKPDLILDLGTDSFKSYIFVLSDSSVSLQSDSNRPSYILYSPNQLQIDLTKQDPLIIDTGTNEDGLDWWIIAIIVGVCVIIVAIIGRFAWNKRLEAKMEKDRADDLDEDLERYEQGQYFDVPENQVNVNPLHNSQAPQDMGGSNTANAQFEMIQDGGTEDKMEFAPTQFQQVQRTDENASNSAQPYALRL